MTNNPLLNEYSTLETLNQESDLTAIEVKRGIGSYFPIFISLGVTLYGFFLFLQTIIETQYVIYGTLIFLGVVLLYVESHRASLFVDYLGSTLEKLVNKLATIPRMGLAMATLITVIFIGLDTWGALQSADSIERMLVEGIVKHSEQYKIEDAKAKSGATQAIAYQQQLKEWRGAKAEHYQGCNNSWRVPTYRTKNQQCKDKFTEAKPTKVNSTGGTIAISKYNELEAKAKEDVAGYRKMFFWVFLGSSILLNYFEMSTLFNQYRRKRKELTPDMIDELTDRMELLNAEKLNKISLSTTAQKEKLEQKNIIDVEIEKETYNIVLAKRAKALNRKKEIPNKIANNQYTGEESKSAFYYNPLGDKNTNKTEPFTKPLTKPFTNTNTMELGAFSEHEQQLINLLWNNGKVQLNEPLVSRDKVLDKIGNKVANTNALKELYKKLLKSGYIHRRVGYFSLVDFDGVKQGI